MQEGNEAPAARLKVQRGAPGVVAQQASSTFAQPAHPDDGVGVGGENDEPPGAGARPLRAKADLTKITVLPKQPAAQAVRVGGRAKQVPAMGEEVAGGMATPEQEPTVAVVGEIFERESSTGPLPPTAPMIPSTRGFPSAKHRSSLKLGKARQHGDAEQPPKQDDQPAKVRL